MNLTNFIQKYIQEQKYQKIMEISLENDKIKQNLLTQTM